jgi:hypothetical protein
MTASNGRHVLLTEAPSKGKGDGGAGEGSKERDPAGKKEAGGNKERDPAGKKEGGGDKPRRVCRGRVSASLDVTIPAEQRRALARLNGAEHWPC